MKNKPLNRRSKLIRGIVLALLVPVCLFALIYAFIWIASIWGRESIEVDGTTRLYRVYVPSSYDGSHPVPLVLAFHMYTGSGRTMAWTTHLNRIAAREGFLVAYPEGYKMSWADGSGQYAADLAGVDDLAFVTTLIDALDARFSIDAQRIYATGFSNGGFLAQRLACALPERFAAIATVGASLSNPALADCAPAQTIPILMINGLDDQGVPWAGTPEYAAIPQVAAHWVTANRCSDAPELSDEPDRANDGTRVRREMYGGCLDEAQVVLYTIEEGGHTWPGGNRPLQLWGLNGRISQDIDASEVIWAFFATHMR